MKAEPVSWKVTGSEPFILIDSSEVEPLVEAQALALEVGLGGAGVAGLHRQHLLGQVVRVAELDLLGAAQV